MQSIRYKKSFKVVLCPKKEIFLSDLPDASEIYSSLKAELGHGKIWVSDMFPHDYLYKPISFDHVDIHNDEEYRKLKKIKSGKYIHRDLLRNCRDKTSLLQGFLKGQITLKEGYIQPWGAANGRTFLKKEVFPHHENPFVYRIRRNTMCDIYLAMDSSEAIKHMMGMKFIQIQENEYDILHCEMENDNSDGKTFVLQANYPVDISSEINEDSSSIFRLGYSEKMKSQYFKAGSCFDLRDHIEGERLESFYPYLIFIE